MTTPISNKMSDVRSGYENFILACRDGDLDFRLTPVSDASAFARCFGIFGLNLIGSKFLENYIADSVASVIASDLENYKSLRIAVGADLAFDKPYLQLLCFSLSALKIIGMLEQYPLEDHVVPLIHRNISKDLEACGALYGKPSSGNLAMFMAIVRIYARDSLGMNTQADIDLWIEAHLSNMNNIGFWEQRNTVTYSQFQNGYHQYEIFEYLGLHDNFMQRAALAVAQLADEDGHFSPYPGGGGCYDYDAGAILLAGKHVSGSNEFDPFLTRLANTIISEQNPDGGFAETLSFRPYNFERAIKLIRHITMGPISSIPEKVHMVASLSRPRFSRISTHWTTYSRKWTESNLWDSWFRVMIVARIQMTLEDKSSFDWHHIDFPGIGYFQKNIL